MELQKGAPRSQAHLKLMHNYLKRGAWTHNAEPPSGVYTARDASRQLRGLWRGRAGEVERPRPGGRLGPLTPPDAT